MVAVALVLVTASAIAIHLLTTRSKKKSKVPPGSLGLPVIGHTLGFLRSLRGNTSDRWIQDRINRYGPVSKLSLFCTPTVLLAGGPAANKMLFFSGMLRQRQARSVHRIIGEKSILDLHGDEHCRIRGALMEFLKPDMLREYVGRVDAKVRQHLEEKWYGRSTVTVQPLMRQLTFEVITSLLFGLEAGAERDALAEDLVRMLEGMFSIAVNLPLTRFSRSLKASRRVRQLLEGITVDKQAKLRHGKASPNNDLITRLLSLTDQQGNQLLTNQEIVENSMVALIAGHDSTSVLITFMVRQLANDPVNLARMVQEQQEIAKNKAHGEPLAWEDLTKMKFTWRVAQETLRLVPPLFGSFRTAIQDMEFKGYCIPKGWQVYLSSTGTHMDPTIFHEPAKFDPSRFESAMPPCSFMAFGGGPTICPGMEFAKMGTLVTMHHLVTHFKWKLCCKENTYARDPFPAALHGLPIKLEQYM
ncbi:cytochrome P450 716B1-like [Triticum urartu]|uniref:Cytochrome P450 716B1 n=1 Tax=Triticum urartu TaxID=4572 RepID=A0A8R7JV46_TRIUA|nr:cytochrome P450 716B1-like [Triticum urartu]